MLVVGWWLVGGTCAGCFVACGIMLVVRRRVAIGDLVISWWHDCGCVWLLVRDLWLVVVAVCGLWLVCVVAPSVGGWWWTVVAGVGW